MKFKSVVLLMMFFTAAAASANPNPAASPWLSRSSSIFFPPQMARMIEANNSFPLFWWNFLVLSSPVDLTEAQKICTQLKNRPGILRAECDTKPTEFQNILSEWSLDYFKRHSRPTDAEIQSSLNSVMVQASLPSSDHALLDLLRNDPFQSWKELKRIAESRLHLKLERSSGFFYDPTTERIVIPIQFNFPPTDSKSTADFLQSLDQYPEKSVSLVGAHGATLQNESQIMRDLKVVKYAGLLTLLLFGGLLVFFKKWRLIFLFPVVFLGTGLSAAITILVFGSIHGLTLSFGTGIVGLALDYGLQGALNARLKTIWESNFCGLMTTVVSLLVLMMSSVPLLRQMMFFSVVGISISFVLFYWIIRQRPEWFQVEAFRVSATPTPFKNAAMLALVGISFLGLLTIRPDLSMKQFDFQTAHTKEINTWLFLATGLTPPLFEIHKAEAVLGDSLPRQTWATDHHISLESLANYIPDPQVQKTNFETWKNWNTSLTPSQKIFFAPFIENQNNAPALIPNLDQKLYAAHLHNEREWISLWLPETEAQTHEIKAAFPNVISLRDVVELFPRTLAEELKWMVPLSILLAALIHFVYYRSVSLALIALLPFFTGVGFLTLCTWILHLHISFISVIGLIMIFGFSLDYGIFATDASIATLHSKNENFKPSGMWSAVILAASTTLAGFIPLIFCRHPVLQHLGQTLVFGAIGTFFGAWWAIPGIVNHFQLRTSRAKN